MPLIEGPAGEVVDSEMGELHPDEVAVLDGLTPDEPEGDTSPEPEPEPETAPAPVVTEKQVEKAFAQLDKAAGSYMGKAVSLIEDLDTGLDKCPCCQYPGLVFPYQGDASEDVIRRQLTEAYFGVVADEYEADPGYVICDACKGQGWRVTPSRVPNNRKIMCTVCNGQGHREVAQLQAQAAVSNVTPISPTGQPGQWQEIPTPDSWGRPPGHPHYGIAPAAVGLSVGA